MADSECQVRWPTGDGRCHLKFPIFSPFGPVLRGNDGHWQSATRFLRPTESVFHSPVRVAVHSAQQEVHAELVGAIENLVLQIVGQAGRLGWFVFRAGAHGYVGLFHGQCPDFVKPTCHRNRLLAQ